MRIRLTAWGRGASVWPLPAMAPNLLALVDCVLRLGRVHVVTRDDLVAGRVALLDLVHLAGLGSDCVVDAGRAHLVGQAGR